MQHVRSGGWFETLMSTWRAIVMFKWICQGFFHAIHVQVDCKLCSYHPRSCWSQVMQLPEQNARDAAEKSSAAVQGFVGEKDLLDEKLSWWIQPLSSQKYIGFKQQTWDLDGQSWWMEHIFHNAWVYNKGWSFFKLTNQCVMYFCVLFNYMQVKELVISPPI